MAKQGTAKRLGRGLSSLISEPVAVESRADNEIQLSTNKRLIEHSATSNGGHNDLLMLPIFDIIPNINQPRKAFPNEALESLAASIRVAGVIQPIAVRCLDPVRKGGDEAHAGAKWELIAGERRWRAAKLAGLESIPAVVHDVTDRVAAEWALVENLQREDLNPVERARALAHLRDEFGLTQTQVAEQVGLDRATVANLIRLTELEQEILDMLTVGSLSAGHGKALLAATAGESRLRLAERAVKEGWSVRRLEREASPSAPSETAPQKAPAPKTAHMERLEKELGDHLGTKLSIKQSSNKPSGVISIHYFDLDHFESVLERLRFKNTGLQ